MRALKAEIDQLRQEIEAIRSQMRSRLDLVDAVTAMDLATGETADVAEAWHRTREGMGIDDDGTGAERIQRLTEWRTRHD